METWEVSLWGWNKARHPSQRRWDWSMMTRHLTERWPVYADKDELPAWSPTVYAEGATRGAEGVKAVTCLVFDFDDGTDLLAPAHAFSDWPFLLHTSWSHTEEHHKFRLILPLQVPVTVEKWQGAYSDALKLWKSRKPRDAGDPDPACSDPCRIYYLPARRDGDVCGFGFAHDDPDVCTWPLGLEGYRVKKKKKKPIIQKRRIRTESEWDSEAKRRIKTDPKTRMEIGEKVGGKVVESSNVVRGIYCPGCGRKKVWFWIDGQTRKTAKCSHENSCGVTCGIWYDNPKTQTKKVQK